MAVNAGEIPGALYILKVKMDLRGNFQMKR